jgi:AbrB family looped-hinge helix DNA binding protein
LGYTVTEKGTVTIPVGVRRRLGLAKGSQVEFVETDEGVRIVPVIPFEKLMGVDRERKKLVYEMIREIQEERAREAVEE